MDLAPSERESQPRRNAFLGMFGFFFALFFLLEKRKEKKRTDRSLQETFHMSDARDAKALFRT